MLEGVATVLFGIVFYVSTPSHPPLVPLSLRCRTPCRGLNIWPMVQGIGRTRTIRGMDHNSSEWHCMHTERVFLLRQY